MDISNTGRVEVQFSSELIIPANYSEFDDEILELEILPGEY